MSSTSNLTPAAIQASTGGVVTIDGAFTNLATGSVRIGIGGTSSSEVGHVNVSGNATLDGTLAVFLTGGFVPTIGQQYSVMTFGSRVGTFATIEDDDGLPAVTYDVLYPGLNVLISAVAT